MCVILESSLKVEERLRKAKVAADKLTMTIERTMLQNPVQCQICGVSFTLPHLTNTVALQRHESSKGHTDAIEAQGHTGLPQSLVPCKGLILQSEFGPKTLFGLPENERMLRIWLGSGCIAVQGSVIESVKLREDSAGKLVLQDAQCVALSETSPELCLQGKGCCKRCLAAANRSKAFCQMTDWAMKISLLDYTHMILEGNRAAQEEQVHLMMSLFPQMQCEDLPSMSFATAVLRTRKNFMFVPTCKQNNALKSFLSRCVRYLTPTMIAGVDPDTKSKLVCYLDALSRGELQSDESLAIVSRM